MGVLVDIFMYSLGHLFLGIFLTVIGVVLMFVLIKSWYKNAQYSVLSFIVGGILFLFLSFQSVLLCGAVSVKSYSAELQSTVNLWVQRLPSATTFTQQESQEILENLMEQRPLISHFIESADFTGHTPASIAEAMIDELNSFMNAYILRRVLWSLFFVVVSVIIVIKSMETYRPSHSSYSESYDYGDF